MTQPIHLSKDNPIPRIEFGDLPPNLDKREKADEETRRDLNKPYEQLLSDAHEEIFNPNRHVEYNIAHSNRRIASIFARAAMEMGASAGQVISLQKDIKSLTSEMHTLHHKVLGYTKCLVILTGVLIALTLWLIFLTYDLFVVAKSEISKPIPIQRVSDTQQNQSSNTSQNGK